MPTLEHVNLFCPICGNAITVSIAWERETGEFGTILSEYPVMSSDPNQVDQHGTCFCDFKKPLTEAMADYYNDGDRLYELIYPPEPVDDSEFDTVEITASDMKERIFIRVDTGDTLTLELSILKKIEEVEEGGLKYKDLIRMMGEEETPMNDPRKMSRRELQRLRDFISLAEASAFDAADLVEDSGHRIETEVRLAIDHLARAMTYVDRYLKQSVPPERPTDET